MEALRYIVVTGASGFVGRHICERLAADGYVVTALRRDGEAPWHLGMSVEESARRLAGADAVVHLAAYLPANYEDLSQAAHCYEANALGTLRLLQAAKSVGVRHFVHASTTALYSPSTGMVDENAPTIPQRAASYLASKLAAEAYVAAVSFGCEGAAAVLRLASVYGPGMPTLGLLPACVRLLKTTGRFTVADANRFRTDLVHVQDVAAAVSAVLARGATGTFNIASGRSVSPLDVAEAAARHLGVPLAGIEVAPAMDRPVPGYTALSIEKAQRELGFQPVALADGLSSYIRALS